MGMGSIISNLRQRAVPATPAAPTLSAAPPGGMPYGRTPIDGQSTGGRSYVPNQFSGGGAMTMGGGPAPMPYQPPAPQPRMQPSTPMPYQPSMPQPRLQPGPAQVGNPKLQQQMMIAGSLRRPVG